MKKIFRNSKVLSFLVIVAAVAVIGGVGSTVAYYHDQTGEKVNEFSVGNVTTEIVEIFNKIDNHTYDKNPRVTNTGMSDCYIRMRYEVTPEKEMEDRLILEGLAGANWVQDGEWYYYTKPVKPGESTTELFNKVKVDYNEKDKPWVDFDIILYQEAVQAEVFDSEGNPVTDAGRDAIWAQYDAQN